MTISEIDVVSRREKKRSKSKRGATRLQQSQPTHFVTATPRTNSTKLLHAQSEAGRRLKGHEGKQFKSKLLYSLLL